MRFPAMKTAAVSTLVLSSLLLMVSSSAQTIEAVYVCPDPMDLTIVKRPTSGDDPRPYKYSGVLQGQAFDPSGIAGGKADAVAITLATSDTYLPKTHRDQKAIKTLKSTLASDAAFCEYVLPDNYTARLETTRDLKVPFANCNEMKTADGHVGFNCVK